MTMAKTYHVCIALNLTDGRVHIADMEISTTTPITSREAFKGIIEEAEKSEKVSSVAILSWQFLREEALTEANRRQKEAIQSALDTVKCPNLKKDMEAYLQS